MARLRSRQTGDATPTIARPPEMRDLGEEVDRDAPVGCEPDRCQETQDPTRTTPRPNCSRRRRGDCLALLPADDWAKPSPGNTWRSAPTPVWMAPIQAPDPAASSQEPSRVEGAADDPVGCQEGDKEGQGLLQFLCSFLCLSFGISLVRTTSPWDSLGGRQRGACNVPDSGRETVKMYAAIVYCWNASMIKPKKKQGSLRYQRSLRRRKVQPGDPGPRYHSAGGEESSGRH